jgi:transcriptional regulator with XRE-family HTH domain
MPDQKAQLRKKTSLTPGEVFALRLHELRTKKGWSQQRLSDRLAELGLHVHRATLSQYEWGESRSKNVPLEHVIAIAVALGVSPMHLFVPFNNKELRVTPRYSVPPVVARQWVRGQTFIGYYPSGEGAAAAGATSFEVNADPYGRTLLSDVSDYRFYFEQVPPEEQERARMLALPDPDALPAQAFFQLPHGKEEDES